MSNKEVADSTVTDATQTVTDVCRLVTEAITRECRLPRGVTLSALLDTPDDSDAESPPNKKRSPLPPRLRRLNAARSAWLKPLS